MHPKNPPRIPKKKLTFLLDFSVTLARMGADIMQPIIIMVIGKVEKHLFSDSHWPARPEITK